MFWVLEEHAPLPNSTTSRQAFFFQPHGILVSLKELRCRQMNCDKVREIRGKSEEGDY
jgi:hypothetical protein